MHRGVTLLSMALVALAHTARAADGLLRDRSVAPAQYVAEQPYPDEPLGFHGGLMQQASVPPVEQQTGLFTEPAEEFHEPLDLDAPAPAVSSGEWLSQGYWYTQQSVVYLNRATNVKNVTKLATDFSPAILDPHARPILDIPVGLGYQPGLRSTLGRYLGRDNRNRDHAVEFTFLGLTHWQQSAGLQAIGTGGIFSDIEPTLLVPAFNASNNQAFAETSSLNSYEINYRIDRRMARDKVVYSRDSSWVRECVPIALPAIFAGVRVVTVNENLLYTASSNIPVSTGSYRISTRNNLVGLQTGADWFYDRGYWRVGMRGKAGALVNWADQSSLVQILDANGAPLQATRNEHAKDHTLGFVGEMNFIGAYRFRPNFALRASYDLMWVSNLALAQNQITFAISNPAQIAIQHSLFYQGLSIGFELSR